MPNLYILSMLFLYCSINNTQKDLLDLTIVGYVLFADGIGRTSVVLAEGLSDSLKINFINTRPPIFTDVPENLKKIMNSKDDGYGKVCLFFDVLWYQGFEPTEYMPQSPIKIAISMIESTKIPIRWVNILNNKFDAVCVPDRFYLKVYKDSGVNIPIFLLPCAIRLDDFLKEQLKIPTSIFTFGSSGSFLPHKNHDLLIRAFFDEFGYDPNVRLLLHGRGGLKEYSSYLDIILKKKNASNIHILKKELSFLNYIEFMKSLDCYVLLSKGEGFSITPREALALGIPSIISNNTAHETLCESSFFCTVNSFILERPIHYESLFGEDKCGYQFNCEIKDVRNALREVYENYQKYKELALRGRKWVSGDDFYYIKQKYISLIKPKKIILGKENSLRDDCLITNSISLYSKYKKYIN